ncbi:MAG: DAK2 domain-containing protein [Lachnospiraceae bacterium]|nr:DAK2 domain-containing protein [Lachnospiraceae bacterium]
MFLAGAKELEAHKDHINELNVFPVPDGDTGMNMTLTIMSAAKEVYALKEPNMQDFCKAVSSGSLRGARGNSGVILSQLFRGFTKVAKTYEELDAAVIAAGCEKATETAYKAVMQPKEGTILTVAKAISEKATACVRKGETDIEVILTELIAGAKVALDKTPELLPVLKEAGVVDSGGAGLVCVLEGMLAGLQGKGIVFSAETAEEGKKAETEKRSAEKFKYLYHTSIAMLLEKEMNHHEEAVIKKYIDAVGDTCAYTIEGRIVNMSLNTNDPGMVIQKALKYGELIDVVVENRRQKKSAKTNETVKSEPKEEKAAIEKNEETAQNRVIDVSAGISKDNGFVQISVGDGMTEIFKSLGVDVIVEGGQTMNPSTEDILKAVEIVKAPVVYVFPNNKNVIMAAEQAAKISKEKQVVVVPTKTVTQGITAMISYVEGASVEENKEAMLSDIQNVKTGEVTYSVRDTSIDGTEIHQGDYMGIGDKGIISVGRDISDVVIGMLDKMATAEAEVVSIYYGKDVTKEDADKIKELVESKYPEVDVELAYGGQPIYYYIISAE